MNARFAEPCRDKPLNLIGSELDAERASILDNRTDEQLRMTCQRDLYLGVFFDGTNNNKYRDLSNDCGSNIARLFEAFIGSPSAEIPSYGGTPSKPLKSKTVLPQDFPFYHKIYIPGLGTACPEVCDKGEGGDKTRGLISMGRLQIRAVSNNAHFGEAATQPRPLTPLMEAHA